MRVVKKTYSKRGFTLAELLVTIAIMAFVSVGAIGGIALMLRMHNSMEQKNNAHTLMTVTEQALSRRLNSSRGLVLAADNTTGTKYHISISNDPFSCNPDVRIDDGTYITVENIVQESDSYDYDLVVYSASDNEILRQHIFIHVSAIS